MALPRSSRAVVVALLAATLGAVAGPASAGPVAAAPTQDAKESARHHLHLGVTLFQERNYTGALAEFEASYRDLPTAAALQNIALCQTRLFRYVAALETLEKLQREFGSSLSADDREAIRKTEQDLAPLVGSLVLHVDPPDAHVTIDGRPLDTSKPDQPIRLASGEYRISGTAPSHAPVEIVARIAGGERQQIDLVLPATAADVSILASNPGAAIVIDREAKSYGAWSGSLAPGSHLLQVYKTGFKPFATQLDVRAGDRIELRLPLGASDPAVLPAEADSSALPYADGDPSQPLDEPPPKGFYGLVAATNTAVLQSPDRFTPRTKGDATGGFFGVRAGYRFNAYFAFEGMFESGGQDVDGQMTDTATGTSTPASYTLTTSRYGGNVRLLAGGRSIRFSGTFGVGAVHHKLVLDALTFAGTNSYFGLEVGPQVNMGKAILELTLQTTFEGATSVSSNGLRPYTDHTIVPQAGIGLRVGYGEWGRW